MISKRSARLTENSLKRIADILNTNLRLEIYQYGMSIWRLCNLLIREFIQLASSVVMFWLLWNFLWQVFFSLSSTSAVVFFFFLSLSVSTHYSESECNDMQLTNQCGKICLNTVHIRSMCTYIYFFLWFIWIKIGVNLVLLSN